MNKEKKEKTTNNSNLNSEVKTVTGYHFDFQKGQIKKQNDNHCKHKH